MKIGSCIQNMIEEGFTDTQHYNLISLLLFFQNKEIKLIYFSVSKQRNSSSFYSGK
jgi:hypothetical protein